MRTSKLAFFIAALVVAGACSSSKSAAPTTTQKATTTTAATDPARDLATAKAAVLVQADLPEFTPTPHDDSDDTPESVKQKFAKCLGVDATLLDETPGAQKADSPDFEQDQASVSSTVEIDPTAADIDKGWDTFQKPKITTCFEALFTEIFSKDAPEGVEFGAPKVTTFDVGIGNRSKGIAVQLSARADGQDLVFYSDFILVARDRAGIQLTTFNLGTPIDRTTAIALAQTMYDRIGTKAA